MITILSNIFILLGIFLGVLFSYHQFKKYLATIKPKPIIDTNDFWNAIIVIALSSFIGGRLYHVINYWEYYLQHPIKILTVWEGGIGVIGAIVFGLWGLIAFSLVRFKRIPPAIIIADFVALGLPLAHAVGRWSNYFSYNFLGAPTKLPWGIEIPFNARPVGYKLYTTYHPLFLYESLLNLILFVFLCLVFIKFKARKSGSVALLYLIGFSLIRLFTEPLLLNSWKVGVFPVASVVSFVILTLSTIVLASMYIPLVIPRSKLPTKSVVVKREIKKSKSQIKKFRIQRKRKSK